MTHTAANAPTLHLTRLRLDPHHPAVRRDLADRNQLHKTLMRLAPQQDSRTPRRTAGLLFRIENGPPHPVILVQTHQPPSLKGLPAGYARPETRNLTPLIDALTLHLPVRYRITASPVRHRPGRPVGADADGRVLRQRGRPTPLHGDAALAWWQRQAHQAGLTVITATLNPQTFETRRHDVHHHLIQFDGHAHIHDIPALTSALQHGIGRAKSYGAGLISLAPSTPTATPPAGRGAHD